MTAYRISEDDFVAAQALHMRATRKKTALRLAAVGLLGIACLLDPYDISALTGSLLAACAATFLVVRYLVVPWRLRKTYRAYKGLHVELDVAREAEGLRFSTADGNSLLRWERVCKWREDARFLLVYPAPNLFNMLPKSIANDGFDLPALQAELQSRVGPAV